MTPAMRVARSLTPRDVVIEEVADPVPGPGEVVCRVLACGVCGSDVSETYVARKLPCVLGHEVVGEVVAVGAASRRSPSATRVVIHHHVPCGDVPDLPPRARDAVRPVSRDGA